VAVRFVKRRTMPLDICASDSKSMIRQGPWHVSHTSTVAAVSPDSGYDLFVMLNDALPGIWGIANQGTALFAIKTFRELRPSEVRRTSGLSELQSDARTPLAWRKPTVPWDSSGVT